MELDTPESIAERKAFDRGMAYQKGVSERELESYRNVWAYAYNAAVNYGTERGHRKMWDLIRALNVSMRAQGKRQMEELVRLGVITSYVACPDECQMRPGGLFHADGCENEKNHPVYRERQRKACAQLPGGADGNDGWRAASVMLVG